ncbi:DUF3239 domain-containing protein [Dietzia sp. UBA5065]|uniref:DUF3239 domain-containing protein n=1 Tax=Dietzia sp. UBA5065 TaxID=1946422 RepID=UPI0025B98736|nr:DUF3239 domain-containing protein [Dietzia sp. UBA5065]
MAADRTPRAPHEQYRLAEFPVDDAWVRKNNESLAEVRRLQWSAGILGGIVLAAGIAVLVYSGPAAWGWFIAAMAGAFALGCLAMIWYIPRKMGSMAQTYATSELIPAVIADVRPRGVTLLALADRAVDRSAGKLPVLVARSCEKIPGHETRVGERVPCVAVVGNRSARGRDNLYQFISPMPVAWATPDTTVLRRLVKEIPAGEWETLRQNLDRVDEVSALPTSLLPLD